MNKVLTILVCLTMCLFFVTCQRNKEEGADCEWNGIKGKCVHPRVCLTSLDRRGKKPPICSSNREETIICCTDCHLVNDTSNFVLNPPFGVLWKDGRKSRDACLQYLQVLPHKCRVTGFYSGILRSLNTEKKCYSYTVWGAGAMPTPGSETFTENPYEALIGFGENQNTTYWLTGGSIIHEKFILTSAHLLTPWSPQYPLKYVAVGVRHWIQKSWQIYKVKQTYLHPDYDADHTRYNDIALMELETAITFDRYILPACLPEPADDFDTSKAKFTLWLKISATNHKLHNFIEAQELTADECNAKMDEGHLNQTENYKSVLPQKVNGDTQVCYKDNVGTPNIKSPIVVTTQYSHCMNTVVGVSSYGQENYPQTVFTKVKHFTPWIESIVWPWDNL